MHTCTLQILNFGRNVTPHLHLALHFEAKFKVERKRLKYNVYCTSKYMHTCTLQTLIFGRNVTPHLHLALHFEAKFKVERKRLHVCMCGGFCVYRGSYMSAHVLLNLLNGLGKSDKMLGLPSI